VLTEADLETNVLEFRQRSFQFARLVERESGAVAVFGRTETESERQLRPKLVRLTLVVPVGWVVHDEAADLLRVARDGVVAPPPPPGTVVEIGAEPPEFEEQGLRWKRIRLPAGGYAYAPAEMAAELLSPPGLGALGIG
jgi:hypothetical protein